VSVDSHGNRGYFFGRNIRFLRRAAGLFAQGMGFSQKELAIALDVTRRSVILWESGNIPSRKNLAKIAGFFEEHLKAGITTDELLKTDFSLSDGLLPQSDFERELSPEGRRIFHSLFLSTRGLSKEELKNVIDYIESIKSG
jgi:transcriptional regulator with XRE-family HTH domain